MILSGHAWGTILGIPVWGSFIAAATALLAAFATGSLLARAGFPLPDERKRLGWVDGLRGLLALLVFVSHAMIWMQLGTNGGIWTSPGLAIFDNLGPLAVGLFFMATGFVFHPRIAAGLRTTNWRVTYISRVFRLFPLQLLVIYLVCVIVLMRNGVGTASWQQNLKALAGWLTSIEPPLFGDPDAARINAHVLWSLHYEWVFYLFVLPSLALARDLTRRVMPGWALPLAFGLSCIALQPLFPTLNCLRFFPFFAVGMLAYELRAHDGIANALATRGAATLAIALLMLFTMSSPGNYQTAQLLAESLIFGCVVCGNSFGGLFSSPAARVLGECSFGIYMLHGIVLDVAFVDLFPQMGQTSSLWLLASWPLLSVAIVSVSAGAYLLVERPGIAFGKAVATGIRPTRGIVVAPPTVAPVVDVPAPTPA